MKPIILEIDNLRSRVLELRRIQAQYDYCATKLHEVCLNLSDVYQIDGKAVMGEDIDLSCVLNGMASKLSNLALLLEERADEIEHEK